MNTLPQTTWRRLKKIPQTQSVWEGDRRDLTGVKMHGANSQPQKCIIWLDSSQGYVRAMDIVSPHMGLEAVVRTLLKAIETPDNPALPARPEKIVVQDREIQFFLRGALQNLDIAVDYVPRLPLIDELFERFEQANQAAPPSITPQHEQLLQQVATAVWQEQPWKIFADHDILTFKLNHWDIGTVYVCITGMLGREYGIIFYRSVESMKQFREALVIEDTIENLEKAFLAQDCWYLNFEVEENAILGKEVSAIQTEDRLIVRPAFGSIHPYEGMRPLRDQEEVSIVYVMLKALTRFCQTSQRQLAQENLPNLSKDYPIFLSLEKQSVEIVATVETMPSLSEQLLETQIEKLVDDEEFEKFNLVLRDDLIPQKAFLSLGKLPGEQIARLRDRPLTDPQHASVPADFPRPSNLTYLETKQTSGRVKTSSTSQSSLSTEADLPIILIQTSRPKAKELIKKIEAAGGLKAICFSPGQDPFTNTAYELGILQTNDDQLYLFGEFVSDNPNQARARQKWQQHCQKTDGRCGLVVAMGITGSSRGNPQPKNLLALFETTAKSAEEIGIGELRLDST